MYRSEYLDVEARAPREKAVLFYGGILLFSLLLLLVSAYMPTQAQADDLATIKARLRATAREGAVADRVTEWARSLDADGAWPDIDYADKARANWSPAQHLSRLQHLALGNIGSVDGEAGPAWSRLLVGQRCSMSKLVVQ